MHVVFTYIHIHTHTHTFMHIHDAHTPTWCIHTQNSTILIGRVLLFFRHMYVCNDATLLFAFATSAVYERLCTSLHVLHYTYMLIYTYVFSVCICAHHCWSSWKGSDLNIVKTTSTCTCTHAHSSHIKIRYSSVQDHCRLRIRRSAAGFLGGSLAELHIVTHQPDIRNPLQGCIACMTTVHGLAQGVHRRGYIYLEEGW